jgi:type IX secretion system substrate protein
LSQNYPNPFNPKTIIRFALPEDTMVKLDVYNILGQRVRILINEFMHSGNHEIEFDSAEISSGIYFYRIDSGKYHSIKKMVLVK